MKHGRKLVRPLIATFFFLAIYASCKKNEPKTAAASKNESRLISGKSTVRTQSWLELRDQAKEEFGFYFGTYYHTRDFLGNLDWEHAIINEMDGIKTMVFLFRTSYADKLDAKLMVKQGDNGQNIYLIRVRSRDSKGKYASIYTANDKILHFGTIERNAFKEFGRTKMQSSTIAGGFPDACNMCHGGGSDEDSDGDEWGDPVPGGSSLWGNNVLGDIVIEGQGNAWNWFDWDSYWDGPVIVIPGGGGGSPPPQTADNDPCATFDALMLNQAFRQKLMALFANTTSDHETAFTYDGTTSSPFAHGPVGGDDVSIDVFPSTTVWAHSHYTGIAPTFSNHDVKAFYIASQSASNPIGFVGAVATPYGISMIKITDMSKFNTFYNNYLNSQSGLDMFGGLMSDNGAGENGGANAANALNNLLNNYLNAGLKVVKVYDPNNSTQPCN